MAEKYDDRSQQVQDTNINSDPITQIQNTPAEAGTDTNQTTDLETKRAPLSRASTLESIKEEDDSSLDEQQVLDSFKSIMDIFANGFEEENGSNGKVSSPGTSTASKSASLSISEDADSLDEEVRQIMSKSEEKQKESQEKNLVSQPEINNLNNFEENKEKKVKEKEEIHEETEESSDYIDNDDDDDDDDTESLATDTESMSDSSSEFISNNEKKGHWSLRDSDESSDDEEFDIEAHINKLCRETIDSDSSSDAEGTDSETEQVRKKVMRMYSQKYGQDSEKEPESEDTESSDAENSDSDDESRQEGTIEEVDVENDQSSMYSSSDGTDSDFLDDDSVSISTASSIDGDYNMEDDNEKETLQAVSEEIPYLSNPAMMPSHEKVYNHYLASRPESCPEKIEVQDGEIGQNIGLDNTLATRSVINLRWPFTSYYVKEFDLDSENPAYEEDGLLPCYKSMKSSASFPGRRRNVMLGRVWWVEWWAKDEVKDGQEDGEGKEGEGKEGEGEENSKPSEKEENLEEVGDMGQFEREKLDTRL